MTLSELVEARLDLVERVAKNPVAFFMADHGFAEGDVILLLAMREPKYVREVLLPSWRERWKRHEPIWSDYYGTPVAWCSYCSTDTHCIDWPDPDALAVCREIGVPVDGDST